MKKKLLSILCICLSFSIVSCDSYEEIAEKRALRAAQSLGDIWVGVAWPFASMGDDFLEGVRFGVDEINASGGILGRQLKIIIKDDGNSETTAIKIAREFSKNMDVVAVIGHLNSGVAQAASITYQYNGILFLSAGATSSILTNNDFDLVFRTIPSDQERVRKLVDYCESKSLKKIAIIDDRTLFGKSYGDLFIDYSESKEIETVFRSSFMDGKDRFDDLIFQLKKEQFDAVVLGAYLPGAAYLVKQAREMGVAVPILSSDALRHPEFQKITGPFAKGTVITTTFPPVEKNARLKKFAEKFKMKYNSPVDLWTVQGYDTIKLLAYAMEQSKSAIPKIVADKLRYLKNWQATTGEFSFKINGDLEDKEVYLKEFKDKQFDYIDS